MSEHEDKEDELQTFYDLPCDTKWFPKVFTSDDWETNVSKLLPERVTRKNGDTYKEFIRLLVTRMAQIEFPE